MGQRDIRRLLVTGAMAVVRRALRRGAPRNPWLECVLERKPPMVAAFALANSGARHLGDGDARRKLSRSGADRRLIGHRAGTRAARARSARCKDTGTVRLVDGDFSVVADLPRRVDGNRETMAPMEKEDERRAKIVKPVPESVKPDPNEDRT